MFPAGQQPFNNRKRSEIFCRESEKECKECKEEEEEEEEEAERINTKHL